MPSSTPAPSRTDGAPLIDLTLFRRRAFAAGTCVALVFALIPGSFFFVLALYLQQGRGYSAMFSGIVFIAVGAGYFLAMFLAGPFGARLGHRVLAVGALGVTAGCALRRVHGEPVGAGRGRRRHGRSHPAAAPGCCARARAWAAAAAGRRRRRGRARHRPDGWGRCGISRRTDWPSPPSGNRSPWCP
ncbi:MFS transporter [Frankia sp. QA3]|uniref:MFS transporter n=1 Tax=Frankia sp. QA3 TaxID=710111 RepID=UPI000269CA64|nr:MFS transporter [Frankia sp. QA3]EIV94735.1 hypothetical protein FraQA3DRAFT_4514 [Frankia sp. QA3]